MKINKVYILVWKIVEKIQVDMDIINIKIKEIDDLIRLQLWDNLNKIIIIILLIKIKIMSNNHMFMIKLILILKIEVILDKICTI